MVPACSIDALNAQLRSVRASSEHSSNEAGPVLHNLMALPSSRELSRIEVQTHLVGLLFARPDSAVAKKDIIPNLSYLHYRSANNVDLFCAGYGADWEPAMYPDYRQVGVVNGTKWFFSDKAFAGLCEELEHRTRWRYMGETDLILVNADQTISFSQAIVVTLEKALRDNAIQSVASFFEEIIKFARNYSGSNPVFDASDYLGLRIASKSILGTLVPKKLADIFRSARHVCVRDISRV